MPNFAADGYSLDQRMGEVVYGTWAALEAALAMNTMLQDTDRFSDAILTNPAGPYQYSSVKVGRIRAAFPALANLRGIAHAQGTQATPNDFFYDAKYLMGVLG
jgi:hypothetical protein